MRRLISAPNLALATLWADMLTHAGIASTVQRAYAGSIAGELPPDQALPEVWVADDAQLAGAIRAGDLDDRWDDVVTALAATALDKVRVANPRYLRVSDVV